MLSSEYLVCVSEEHRHWNFRAVPHTTTKAGSAGPVCACARTIPGSELEVLYSTYTLGAIAVLDTFTRIYIHTFTCVYSSAWLLLNLECFGSVARYRNQSGPLDCVCQEVDYWTKESTESSFIIGTEVVFWFRQKLRKIVCEYALCFQVDVILLMAKFIRGCSLQIGIFFAVPVPSPRPIQVSEGVRSVLQCTRNQISKCESSRLPKKQRDKSSVKERLKYIVSDEIT